MMYIEKYIILKVLETTFWYILYFKQIKNNCTFYNNFTLYRFETPYARKPLYTLPSYSLI